MRVGAVCKRISAERKEESYGKVLSVRDRMCARRKAEGDPGRKACKAGQAGLGKCPLLPEEDGGEGGDTGGYKEQR